MKTPNKWQLQQVAFHYSSDTDTGITKNLEKVSNAKPFNFLVIDTTLVSHNPLHFRKNLLERIQKLIMKTDDQITDEKLSYDDINREAAKISLLS